MPDEDGRDEIAEWADRLTPEGAPGEIDAMMRRVLGDQGYERAVAEHETLSELNITRQRLINKILELIIVFGTAIGALSSGALVALLFRKIFG